MAEEIPQAGSYNAGLQVSSGNIDHDSFSNDNDGVAQLMLYVDYYFTSGWAIGFGLNTGSGVQEWICENADVNKDYCVSDDDSMPESFKSDLDYSNVIVAVRFDTKLTEHNFIYGKLGGQYGAFSEIAVRREVNRESQSQYYLNGSRCRKRDITDIFLGTGLGPRSYAIIEQGMISRLIESKPVSTLLIH